MVEPFTFFNDAVFGDGRLNNLKEADLGLRVIQQADGLLHYCQLVGILHINFHNHFFLEFVMRVNMYLLFHFVPDDDLVGGLLLGRENLIWFERELDLAEEIDLRNIAQFAFGILIPAQVDHE